MTADLLPCPFCGGSAERIDFGPGSGDNEGGSCIACTKCQSSGPVEFGYKENFVSNWNRRALSHAAGQEVVVPEGWALVPKGASVAMCEAGAKHLADYGLGTAWADMIDAAPIAPAPASTSAEVGRDGDQCRAASEEPDAWLYEYEHDGESDHCLSRVRFLPSWVEAKRATEHPLYLRALSRGVPEGNAVIPWRDEIDRMYVEGWAQSLRRIKDYRAYFIEHGYHPEYVAVRLERLLAAIAAQRKEGE